MSVREGADDAAPAEDAAPAVQSRRVSPLDSVEAVLGVVPKRLMLPLPRWLGPLALACTIGIIPWIVYLAMTLPAHQRADDYDIAWVGYDAAMCLVLAALAYCALRRKPATGPIAAVAATMLVVDAWFDVVTTEDHRQFVFAIISAACAEIPLAIICGWVAINAERVRARAYRSLRLRWERALEIVHSAVDEAALPVTAPPVTAPPVTDPPGPPPPR